MYSRQDDRLSQIVDHEAQGRASVGQTVRPMQDDKRVKEGIIPLDRPRNLAPSLCVDAGAVEQWIKLEGGKAHSTGML